MKYTWKSLVSTLLGQRPAVRLEQVTIDREALVLTLRSTRRSASCPVCAGRTRRVHSHYRPQIADLPWAGRAVRLNLQARRFRCPKASCPRLVFAERLPALVAPRARRTQRAASALLAMSVALGGEAGSRLARQLGLPVSPATLLHHIRQASPDLPPASRAIGVDDFAWRRGHTYGTIIVDLELRRPRSLLPDRSAATLANWFREQPSVEIISRDRSPEYARAISQAVPMAIQVIDRWHLLRNLREALERMLDRHHQQLAPIALPARGASSDHQLVRLPRSRSEEAARAGCRVRREERYQQVLELNAAGVSQRGIARQLGMHRVTVRSYLQADGFPERAQHRRQPSILDPFLPYLEKCWAAGCENGRQLWGEVRALGYPGTRKRVAQWAQQRRLARATGEPTDSLRQSSRRPAARQLVWLLLRAPDRLTATEGVAFAQMQQSCPAVAVAYPLAQEFVRLVRQRSPDDLACWFADVAASGVPDLVGFAAGLQRDESALRAALTLPWSNGPTEGQITKLKLLKRQMYGRAKLDLLQQRLLLAN